MDADLQHPPAMIKQMLDALQTGTADQVIARRSRRGDPRVRTGLSRLYYRLVNAMIDVELQDGVGDFRMLSRRAVDALLALPESNRFSKGLFAWIGFPVTTLEYDNVGRNSGESAWTLRTLVNYGIDGIISFNDRPLRIMTWIGAVATCLGVCLPGGAAHPVARRCPGNPRLFHHHRRRHHVRRNPVAQFGNHGRVRGTHLRRGETAPPLHHRRRQCLWPGRARPPTRRPGGPDGEPR